MNRELLCATLADCLAHPHTADLAAVLQSAHPSDLAGAMHTASDGQVMQLLAEMNAQERADIFVYFPPERQTSLLALLPRHMAVALVEGMAADERADLYHQLDESQRERLLLALNREERDDILRLAAYAEGSTGSATTSDFVACAARYPCASCCWPMMRAASGTSCAGSRYGCGPKAPAPRRLN